MSAWCGYVFVGVVWEGGCILFRYRTANMTQIAVLIPCWNSDLRPLIIKHLKSKSQHARDERPSDKMHNINIHEHIQHHAGVGGTMYSALDAALAIIGSLCIFTQWRTTP